MLVRLVGVGRCALLAAALHQLRRPAPWQLLDAACSLLLYFEQTGSALLAPGAVYLCKYFTLQGYCYMTGCAAATSYGGLPYYFYGSASFNSDHLNAFDYWSEAWTTDMKARGERG